MERTLLIMAAGMGSRYGGNKQIDGMGPHGEMLMFYSIFDAIEAGFTKVVFVIKRDFEERFKELLGTQLEGKIKVEFAFQDLHDLPEGYSVPLERTKPLGTVQAVLTARDLIHEPFAVINADDYYGKTAFKTLISRLNTLQPEGEACMAGYYLKNTVSEHGHVTRGVCSVDEKGKLTAVTETYKIKPFPDGTIRDTEKDPAGVILDPNSLVSMNFFGFTPWLFTMAMERFKSFLASLAPTELKAEYVLPVLVDQLMHSEGLKVDVLPTDSTWFGVTYQEDKPYVQTELLRMHQRGDYPERLF
ncbi:MAG: hypothetical protein GXY67_10310 [Clostridiales bacterium]|nr:hypothetical protein [Clostridiales bacterium]